MTMPTASTLTPATQAQEIRFYQIASGKHTWYAITAGKLLVSATRSHARAVQYYAWERGIPRAQVGGPTHQVADARELSVSLANQEQGRGEEPGGTYWPQHCPAGSCLDQRGRAEGKGRGR